MNPHTGQWPRTKGVGQSHQLSRRLYWQMTMTLLCNEGWIKTAAGTGGKQSIQVRYFVTVGPEVTGLQHVFVVFIACCWSHYPVYRCSLLLLYLHSVYNTGRPMPLLLVNTRNFYTSKCSPSFRRSCRIREDVFSDPQFSANNNMLTLYHHGQFLGLYWGTVIMTKSL